MPLRFARRRGHPLNLEMLGDPAHEPDQQQQNDCAECSRDDLADEASSQLAVVAVALRSWGAQRPWELEAVGLPSTSEGLLAWLSQR